MMNIFLEYGASLNEHGGEALDISVRSENLEQLQVLLQGTENPSPDILSRIFQSALKLEAKTRHLAVEMILRAGRPVNDEVAAAMDGLCRMDSQTCRQSKSFYHSTPRYITRTIAPSSLQERHSIRNFWFCCLNIRGFLALNLWFLRH